MDWIEGRNPVREALRAGRALRRVLVAEGAGVRGALLEIVESARAAGVRVDRVPRAMLDRLARTPSHQGVMAEAEAFRYRSWREGLELAASRAEAPLLLALDGITDPQNLGSLVRSAECAGCHAILVPARRSSPVTAVVEKASAGALEHAILDRVPNLERALAQCKQRGLWVVGLEAKAGAPIWECSLLAEPVVLVVGAEGRGLGRLVAERADALASLPMTGKVGSLNAAVAGAVALYEAVRRRRSAGPSHHSLR